MITSENMQEFARQLAEIRPAEIFSMTGTHAVEYMDSSLGEMAIISVELPQGMDVTLEDGTAGPLKAINVLLPATQGEQDEDSD